MKILALIGSPRIGSNTDILLDWVLQGAQSSGHATEKIYLYDYQISPCLDCRRCKKDDFTCHLLDGMSEIYPRLEEADLIVFRHASLLVRSYSEDEASHRPDAAVHRQWKAER
jgi:multimeric flavodoxin WrbA